MPMHFDQEQEDAIQITGTNVLVSASAGAGKTGVLVARLVKRCVQDRIPLRRILAVTFTEAAAGEMKKRLAGQLSALYAAAPSDSETRSYLHEQLIDLESASITTIDAFCLKIIQKYCNVIGLDPATAQNILDEGMMQSLQTAACRQAIQEYDIQHHDQLLQLLEYFCPRSEDYDTLQGILLNIISHADSSPDPDAWLAKARDSYRPVRHLSDFDPAVLELFYTQLRIDCSAIQDHLQQMARSCRQSEKADPAKIQAKLNLLTPCFASLKEHNYDGFCALFANAAEQKTDADKNIPAYTAAREAMTKAENALLKILFDSNQLVADSNDLSLLCASLVDLAALVRTDFRQIKRDHACMDFTDMERYAYEILCVNDGEVAGVLRNSLQEILIDEFQDTSELQNAIIERIARPDNVFRVGDVKQSIYRFRQAKPQLMRRLMQDPANHTICLKHNYRSRQSIVSFCNLLFSRVMNVEGCLDTYTDSDTVSVGQPEQHDPQPVPVRFILLPVTPGKPDQEEADEEGSEETDSPAGKQLKAEWIAGEICRLKAEDPHLSWRSFAVLVRSHADKPNLRRAFDKVGIPYDIDAREGFYQSELCQTILALVRAMLNPEDEISLLSVLTSSLFDLDDDAIAQLKFDANSLYQGVRTQRPDILAELQQLKDIGQQHGVTEMLSELTRRHDFYLRLSDSQKANFDFLFEKAAAADQSAFNLYHFLTTMEASEDENSSEAMAKGADDDVVTVTTIHQSKGLQYPIVFLWSASQNRFSDSSLPVLADDELMLGISHLDMPWRTMRPTVQRIALECQGSLDDLEEFTRLIYVALTRAMNRLYLVDSYKKEPPACQPLTLSVLRQRRGITGEVLAALPASSLFDITLAQPQSISPAAEPPAEESHRLPVFTIKTAAIPQRQTPSATELTSLPDLDLSGSDAGRHYGTLMHEWIAALPNRIWTPDDLKAETLKAEDCQKLLAFSDSSLYHHALTMEIHKEFPFCVLDRQKQILLSGAMDFVAVSSQEVLLIDFKTDSADGQELLRRYWQQLDAYRRALTVMYPNHSIQAYIWSLANAAAVEVPLNPAQR